MYSHPVHEKNVRPLLLKVTVSPFLCYYVKFFEGSTNTQWNMEEEF
jgi:hypothetical protein